LPDLGRPTGLVVGGGGKLTIDHDRASIVGFVLKKRIDRIYRIDMIGNIYKENIL
jgi:hypothetical protein